MSRHRDIKRIQKLLHDDMLLFSLDSVTVDYIIELLKFDVLYVHDILQEMEKQNLVRINRGTVPFRIELVCD